MSAKFEVDSLFIIKGRGHVIVGWLRAGVIKIGMAVSIPIFPQKLVIQGIEMISTVNSPELKGAVGLLFPLGSGHEDLLWKDLDFKGQVLNIEDVNEPTS